MSISVDVGLPAMSMMLDSSLTFIPMHILHLISLISLLPRAGHSLFHLLHPLRLAQPIADVAEKTDVVLRQGFVT